MLSKKITKQVAKEFNITPGMVDKLYHTWWQYIRKHIESIDLQEDITKPTDINLPGLGKLIVNLKRREYINESKINKNRTN